MDSEVVYCGGYVGVFLGYVYTGEYNNVRQNWAEFDPMRWFLYQDHQGD